MISEIEKNGLEEEKMKKKTIQKKRIEDRRALAAGEENRFSELAKSLEELEAYAYVQPRPMWSRIFDSNEEAEKIVGTSLSAMFKSFANKEKKEIVLSRIFSEIILGAHQDRMVAYAISPTGLNTDSTEAMETIRGAKNERANYICPGERVHFFAGNVIGLDISNNY